MTQQYVKELQKSDKSKMSLLSRDDRNLRRDKEASNSIVLTWQMSFEHIRQIRQPAADLLSLMSLFDRQAIPKSLLKERSEAEYAEGGVETADAPADDDRDRKGDSSSEDGNGASRTTSDHDFEDDVTMLRGYSFIAITTDVATFEMHRLVQLSPQRWLEAQGQLGRWQKQFIISPRCGITKW